MLAIIEQIGEQVRSTDKERWDKLLGHVLDIFKAHEKDEDTAHKTWASTQNQ